MRLKTFLATYMLFLCIMFAGLGIVSVYLMNSQTDMLKTKGVRDYHAIAAMLAKDIAVLYGREAGAAITDSSASVKSLLDGYTRYYKRFGIDISVTAAAGFVDGNALGSAVSLIQRESGHFVHVSGALPEPFENYRFDYYLDVTNDIKDTQNIQNLLLLFAASFSVIAAVGLYFILSAIFRPLAIVADTSRKIADGQYSERINVKGKHEIAAMAEDFNRMSAMIEKQIRDLEEEAIAKQQFVDNLAHEIRTPLTSIYGYAEYMQKAPLDEQEIIESAQFIIDEAEQMKNIADSLLELATLRDYSPTKAGILLHRLFDDVARSLEKALKEQKVRLICRSSVDVLCGQEDLIKSLLMNLCHNALKSCRPDTGIVHLTADGQDEKTIISVADNGCGIPPEAIAKVTEPFYRVDKERSRERGGAGLGLALCRQIAEAHDAEMLIESAAGLGTTVKIIFTSP